MCLFRSAVCRKSDKGFLYSKGYRALITHSVMELLEEASKIEESFGRFIDRHYIGLEIP
ncbi:MAG: hypothetical protein QW493_05510 [Candidatus Bathyarchaeia archaeon]